MAVLPFHLTRDMNPYSARARRMFEKQLIVVATLTNEIKHLHTDDHVSDTDIRSLATNMLSVGHSSHRPIQTLTTITGSDDDATVV